MIFVSMGKLDNMDLVMTLHFTRHSEKHFVSIPIIPDGLEQNIAESTCKVVGLPS